MLSTCLVFIKELMSVGIVVDIGNFVISFKENYFILDQTDHNIIAIGQKILGNGFFYFKDNLEAHLAETNVNTNL